MTRLGILVLLCTTAFGADPGLDTLRSTLLPMRGNHPGVGKDTRGATPQLSVAKHQLRDWLDVRIAALDQDPDPSELQRNFNKDIRDASLSCTDEGQGESKCPDWTLSGFVGPLKIEVSQGFLVVISGIGIQCGYDESAYIYGWKGEKWVRVWQNEQDTYTKEKYKPQTLHQVLISPYNPANDYLVLTLGSESWCSSNWHDVYYRVFRLGPDQQAEPLISGGEWTAVGWRYPPILGSLSNDDVLVEYLSRSFDSGILAREGVFHYQIQHGEVRRIDPIALSPRDFVDEWLKTDWRESYTWSETANLGAMGEWWKKLDKQDLAGEYEAPTMHCRSTPDLWQVGLDLITKSGETASRVYFLVRWSPPYRFRMVAVSDKLTSGCIEEDSHADDPNRRLFPVQDWR